MRKHRNQKAQPKQANPGTSTHLEAADKRASKEKVRAQKAVFEQALQQVEKELQAEAAEAQAEANEYVLPNARDGKPSSTSKFDFVENNELDPSEPKANDFELITTKEAKAAQNEARHAANTASQHEGFDVVTAPKEVGNTEEKAESNPGSWWNPVRAVANAASFGASFFYRSQTNEAAPTEAKSAPAQQSEAVLVDTPESSAPQLAEAKPQ